MMQGNNVMFVVINEIVGMSTPIYIVMPRLQCSSQLRVLPIQIFMYMSLCYLSSMLVLHQLHLHVALTWP